MMANPCIFQRYCTQVYTLVAAWIGFALMETLRIEDIEAPELLPNLHSWNRPVSIEFDSIPAHLQLFTDQLRDNSMLKMTVID